MNDDWRETEERAWRVEARVRAIEECFPRRALSAALAYERGELDEAQAFTALKSWQTPGGIVVLSGPPGTCKTSAATWLALQGREEGPWTPRGFRRAAEFAALSRYDVDAQDRCWRRYRWLLLDDLGAEYSDAKGHFRTNLDELVDVFYADARTLVITTNLVSEEFRARYGDRVIDRMREVGTWIAIREASRRSRGKAG